MPDIFNGYFSRCSGTIAGKGDNKWENENSPKKEFRAVKPLEIVRKPAMPELTSTSVLATV